MKKSLAVLVVALTALAALFADGQATNPDTIKITYRVTASPNAFASLVRFLVDSTSYTGSPVAVQQGVADNGISAGSVLITVQDASRNKTGQEQKTYVKLTPPTNWRQGGNGYSLFTAGAFDRIAPENDSSNGVATALDDAKHTIIITYPAAASIERDAAPVTVCAWKLEWSADTNAPVGDFTATIGVAYTAL